MNTILAPDLGKFNSVLCRYEPDTREAPGERRGCVAIYELGIDATFIGLPGEDGRSRAIIRFPGA